MFYTYGIHKREWNKYKVLVSKNGCDNIELMKEFQLNEKQIWFLFTKLLQDKFNYLYLRDSMNKEDIKKGQYVYNSELGNGVIVEIMDFDFMLVEFESKKLPVMCSQKGYTVYDSVKRKITKR